MRYTVPPVPGTVGRTGNRYRPECPRVHKTELLGLSFLSLGRLVTEGKTDHSDWMNQIQRNSNFKPPTPSSSHKT